jgi:hypothetical protein
MHAYAVLLLLSVTMASVASYWAGVNHGWEKHKKYVKWTVQEQENWEPLA